MRARQSLSPAHNRMVVAVAVLLGATSVIAVGAAPPADAAGPARSGAAITPSSTPQFLTPFAVRGGGFRSRPRINPSTRNRPVARRNPNTGRAVRSFSRAILRALGIAFLLSFLFGIGPGGSPLGLLLLLGIIALIVISRRHRRQYSYR